MGMDSDQALRLLGKFSKWQLRSYCIYAFGFGVPYAWMLMSVVFIGDTPNYRCAIPEGNILNETIPQTCDEGGHCQYDSCHMYRNLSVDNTTVACQHGYWYDPASGYQSTLVTEFDLVCGKNWLVELAMTINQVGGVLGAFVLPQLSDAFGRKTIFLVCMWSNVVIAFIQAFSVNMWMYSVLGFLDGFQQQGIVATAFILGLELFPTEQRTLAGVVVEFFWALGYVSLIPIAYFIRNWRHLQIAITAPLVLTVLFYWYLAESVPWLVANKKYKKAEAVLTKAAKFNKISYPEHIFTGDPEELKEFLTKREPADETADMDKSKGGLSRILDKLQRTTTKEESEKTEDIPKYTIKDIFRSRTILVYSLIQWFNWFVASLGYNAISLTVTYLPGNRYVNAMLYSLIEVPAYIILWIMFH